MDYSNIILNVGTWKGVGLSTGMVLVALVLGSFLHSFVFAVLTRMAHRTDTPWDEKALGYTPEVRVDAIMLVGAEGVVGNTSDATATGGYLRNRKIKHAKPVAMTVAGSDRERLSRREDELAKGMCCHVLKQYGKAF